jgi:hypothetical protein
LKPEQFPPLFAARTAITDEQLGKGARAWAAFCAPDPAGLLDWTREDPALPFLAGAIRRHIEDYPDETTGLARSERQILQVLSEGDRTPEQTFVAASQLEERIFMGDASFWVIARRLIDAREPLIAADVDRERSEGVAGRISLPSGLLRITAAGRDVLAGRADHVALNGISRWLGGVRLSPDRLWRRTSRGQLRPGA